MRIKTNDIVGLFLIACGGLLYVFFRSPQILLLQLIDSTPISGLIHQLRLTTTSWQPPEWMVYCLPNGLWSAAYILMVHSLFQGSGRSTLWRWACVIPILGAVSELGQAFHLVPGTFDIADLISYLLPLLIYSFYLSIKKTYHG